MPKAKTKEPAKKQPVKGAKSTAKASAPAVAKAARTPKHPVDPTSFEVDKHYRLTDKDGNTSIAKVVGVGEDTVDIRVIYCGDFRNVSTISTKGLQAEVMDDHAAYHGSFA